MLRVLLPILLISSVSCSIFGPNDRDELRNHRDSWEARNLIDYSYMYRRDCFCGFPDGEVRVVVQGEKVVAVLSIPEGDSVIELANDSWPTIDSLFVIADGAIGRAAEVTIEYDQQFHFPSLISIDWRKDTIDDEVSYIARAMVED